MHLSILGALLAPPGMAHTRKSPASHAKVTFASLVIGSQEAQMHDRKEMRVLSSRGDETNSAFLGTSCPFQSNPPTLDAMVDEIHTQSKTCLL